MDSKYQLPSLKNKKCAVIVAHPDDETLWVGGIMLLHPETEWTVVSITRKSDPDRAPKFFRALEQYNARGAMGDIDDGPDQNIVNTRHIQDEIMSLLFSNRFDVVITHSPHGEYTRHLRHEETAEAVMTLWKNKKIISKQLWQFAYEDGDRKYLPKAIDDANITIDLPEELWQKKYKIITEVYNFAPESFEAKVTPRTEAFWCHRFNI
jgi:LmbE family N-acetylglucosaminyl deacetylase